MEVFAGNVIWPMSETTTLHGEKLLLFSSSQFSPVFFFSANDVIRVRVLAGIIFLGPLPFFSAFFNPPPDSFGRQIIALAVADCPFYKFPFVLFLSPHFLLAFSRTIGRSLDGFQRDILFLSSLFQVFVKLRSSLSVFFYGCFCSARRQTMPASALKFT